MKFISRKSVTVLVSLVALSGLALASNSAQGDSSQNESGPMRILVHGAW